MSGRQAVEVVSSTSSIPYRPLESPRHIRLFRARRRGPDRAITISLQHFSLDAQDLPRFTAFSYVWGDPAHLHPEPVVVNDDGDGHGPGDGHDDDEDARPHCRCRILASLHPILALVCDHTILRAETWFWADYLCIDQANARERGRQVALMGSLYRDAYRTVVWLGEGGDAAETAGASDALLSVAAWPLAYFVPEERARATLRSSIGAEKWRAMSAWMASPWWTRVWTLQEFLLAGRLVFHCGQESITKQAWVDAITAIYDYQAIGLLNRDAFGHQWARMRLLEHFEDERTSDKMSLVAMMAYLGYYRATDDRDRIYALLGVCTDVDREIVGKATYDASVGAVYTRLATRFFEVHQSLDLICFAALFNGPLRLSAGEDPLPSWVPDWRRWGGRTSRPVPSMVSEPSRHHIGNFRPIMNDANPVLRYAASGDLPAWFAISDDQRRLSCRGVVVGVVDGLGPGRRIDGPGPGQDPPPDPSAYCLVQTTSELNKTTPREATPEVPGSATTTRAAVSDAILESLVRCLSLDRSGRYLTSAARPRGYVHELQRAVACARSTREENHRSLPGAAATPEAAMVVEWFFASAELRVRGATLAEHLEAATPPPPEGEEEKKEDEKSEVDATAANVDDDDGDVYDEQDEDEDEDEDNYPPVGKHTLWRAAESTAAVEWSRDCRLVATERGDLGMGPGAARKGDVVCVLVGCSVPVVLRGDERRGFVLVGECFVPGYMQGEALAGAGGVREMVLV